MREAAIPALNQLRITDTGLRPVFFGETLFGRLMPNLTYMLAFKDMADRDKNWDTFRTSAQWAGNRSPRLDPDG